MIEYKKCALDTECVELLRKLHQNQFPLDCLINELNAKKRNLVKVYYDKKLYGIIVVRAIYLSNGELCLIVDHIIGEDNLDQHFSSILKESLAEFVANEKFNGQNFRHIHIHAYRPQMKRFLVQFMGEPQEFIFMKDIREYIHDPVEFNRAKTSAVAN